MKITNFKYAAFLFAMVLFFTGCKEDDEIVLHFTGDYVINKAELSEALTVPTVESGNFTLPVGTDITGAIQQALLGAVSCGSPDKSYVELREDLSMYLSCEGSNPLNAGTWKELSETSLELNMNSTAIPPYGFVLTVTDVVQDANGISGLTMVPMPKEMIASIIEPLQLTLSSSASVFYLVNFSIEFVKK